MRHYKVMEMESGIYLNNQSKRMHQEFYSKITNEEVTDSRMGMRDSCAKFFPFSASVSPLPSVGPILPASN